MSINLTISATWDDYDRLLELRGDRREPQLAFDTDKIGIDGNPEDWSEPIRAFIQELIEDEEDLRDAAEQKNERISWEEVKHRLNLQ